MSEPADSGRRLYVGTGGFVVALEASHSSVREVWRTNLGAGLSLTAVVAARPRGEPAVVYATCAHRAFGLRGSDGVVEWSSSLEHVLKAGTSSAGFSICTLESPAGLLLLLSTEGLVCCVARQGGALMWVREIPDCGAVSVICRPVGELGSGHVLVATNCHVLRIDAGRGGQELWRWPEKGIAARGSASISLAMECTTGALFAGVLGLVVRLDPATGSVMGQTTVAGQKAVSLSSEDGALFAGANGELQCIYPSTGSVVWKNGLKGCGYTNVSIVTLPGTGTVAAALNKRVVIVMQTGETVQVVKLPGCGAGNLGAVVDGNRLLVCGPGRMYGLDLSGALLWSSDLPGLGHGFVTVATAETMLDTWTNYVL